MHSLGYIAAAAAKSLRSCPTLCDPIDSSPTGIAPLSLGFSRLENPGVGYWRILEWVAISFSNA